MVLGGNRKRSVVLASVLGAVLIAVAVALNVSWIVVNWRTGLWLFVGVLSFMVLIAGLILNLIFLIREIRRNEQHDAFINAVTHELKTPVASIKLYLQTLEQRDLERDKELEFIHIMLADSDRLQSTIDQVLLAGKLGATGRSFNRDRIDLAEVAGECVKIAGRRHNLTNGELEFVDSLDAQENSIIEGDLDEVKAALANLIDNALKYSTDPIKVVVEVVRLGPRKAAVHVSDQGLGITSDELKRVFRRFYRIPGVPSSRVKGTGLGLSIVLAVARRHGGRAYAQSEGEGRGSRFTLELPLQS